MSIAIAEAIQRAAQPVAPEINADIINHTLIEIQEAECILIEFLDENVQDLAVGDNSDTVDGSSR